MIPTAVPGTFLALPACFKEWRQVNMFSCMKPGTTDHILRSASGPGAFHRLSSLRVSGMHKNCGGVSAMVLVENTTIQCTK